MTAGYFGSPEDFVVEEIPLYEPVGEGGHTFVWVEKRLLDTEAVARLLARHAGVGSRDIGYAGRKDRMAVTRQHFSVPGLAPDEALALSATGLRVLRATAHPHKLRTGQLAGNRFDICVRGVLASAVERATLACPGIVRRGLPNRFGHQRFGRDGANVERGRRLLSRKAVGRDRRAARFLLSALQAAAFNEVLARRPVPLDRVERGDVARKTDSGGLFVVEDEVAENARAARFEISATGPLFGTRMEEPQGEPAAREVEALSEFGLERGIPIPRGVRLRGGRRPLRVPVADLIALPEDDALRLRFSLPAGSYATVLLEELLGFQPGSRGRVPDEPEPEPEPETEA